MLVASLMLVATQATVPERPNPMDLGPSVGQALPAFEARDQHDVLRNLDSLKGPNGLMLLIFRSADW